MNNNTYRSIRHVSADLAKRGPNRSVTHHYPPALANLLDLFDVFDVVAVHSKTETVGIQTSAKQPTKRTK